MIALDPSEHRRLGLMEYDETLPLEDHEVVLTFDDGPIPPSTPKVLDALAAECVKATFFRGGRDGQGASSAGAPRIPTKAIPSAPTPSITPISTASPADAATRRFRAASHRSTRRWADRSRPPSSASPIWRPRPAQDTLALKLGLTVWSTDIHANDWNRLTPERVAGLAMQRLERNRKGILMLHDIHERTALAVPLLLKELKARGYSVVHVVPADADHPKTAASAGQWTN